MELFPIILCGGAGTRLWPASTRRNPKPFLALSGKRSLLQLTVARFVGLPTAAAPLLVIGADLALRAKTHLAETSITGHLLAEPVGRNSGPALIAAALHIVQTHPDAILVAVASDHFIPDSAAFCNGVVAAAAGAEAGRIVTFGVRPTSPATGYGYIRPAEILDAKTGLCGVGAFVEKPDLARAEQFVADGYLWNSGNFVVRADVLLREAAHHTPGMLATVTAAVASGRADGGIFTLGSEFAEAPNQPIDTAIMERTNLAAVLPIDYAWSDLGSWNAVKAMGTPDPQGNVTLGDVTMTDTEDCLVRADPGRRVIAIGLRHLAIVISGDDVLISDLGASDALKMAVEAGRSDGGRLR